MTEFIFGVSRHAQERMAQYYGAASRAEWHDLLLQILDRRAVLVSTRLPRHADETWNEIWACQVRGDTVRVVWSPLSAIVVTVLPPNASTATYAREKMHVQRQRAHDAAMDVRKERPRAWRREWERGGE